MVCLDTSFAIDVIRGNKIVKPLLEEYEKTKESVYLTTPTIMELVKGAHLSVNTSLEKERIINFLSSLLVLNFNIANAFKAGEIEANLRREGAIIQIEDIMIAATCISKNETLITRNKKHFERIKGLKIQSY
ncbi:MAG: PIN domain-containing protein [Nanoarchaeota archaeon]